MADMSERQLVGLDYLHGVTELLQRFRSNFPTEGQFEAAELQWWWRKPRSTDGLPQLFWFDEDGRPEAAAIFTDWSDGDSALYADPTLTPILMPDATNALVEQVVARAMEHAKQHGIAVLEAEVDRADAFMLEVVAGHGFLLKEDGTVEAWLEAGDRPEVTTLSGGYRLVTRAETTHLPHHMIRRNGPDLEQRLGQTSLYRSDLDLAAYDADDNAAAYGMFWYDPVTNTGVVEPMRTEEEHQRRGLARHILTAGVNLLFEAGAKRVSIGYEPDNPASGHLYRSVGFQPTRQTDLHTTHL